MGLSGWLRSSTLPPETAVWRGRRLLRASGPRGAALGLALAAALPALASAQPAPPVAADGYPLAGWHGGLFYLRDTNDNFRLYIQGRAQVDSYSYAGAGVSDTALKSTLLLRRIRPELGGEFLQGTWQFLIAGDWGQSSLDNPKGTNETSAASPGASPTATSGRYNAAQTPTIRAQATDVWINYHHSGLFNIQVGEYNAPFTLEGVQSEKTMPLLERNMGSRLLALPSTKEIGGMVWGETSTRLVYYALGIFNGDGQNRTSPDNRGDVIGRVVLRPFATTAPAPLRDAHLGVSFRYGSRDKNYVNYDYAALTTQSGYAFWSPVYAGAKGATHILPSSIQYGAAAELRVPFAMFDFQSELLYVDHDTREAVEGYQATNTERAGEMKGYSYYVQLDAWVVGPRDLTGQPGFNPPAHADFSVPDPAEPGQAVQLVARWEQLRLNYSSASRHGDPDKKNIDGDIKVSALSFAANYWATRHLRLTAEYVLNMFPDSAPVTASSPGSSVQDSRQRAQSPANGLARGINDAARDGSHTLHEILFRAAVGF